MSSNVEPAEYPSGYVAPPPAPVPTHLGQGTAIEQSRAVAEVQAAVVVAQQRPRSMQHAIAQMTTSCQQPALAEKAFYRYTRGGKTVTGASIHLARELARCFGNMQYGIAELRRNDPEAYSEMQAWAWDLETNTRPSTIFVVPHKRDTKDGVKVLTDMRDIYESNTNNAARRVREMIFAVLPPWFVEQAKNLCAKTLREGGGGKTVEQRIADAIKAFEQLGVVVDQLEQKTGRPRDRWTEYDLAQLIIVFNSLQRGEVTVDEEFPPERVTAAEITGAGGGAGQQSSHIGATQREGQSGAARGQASGGRRQPEGSVPVAPPNEEGVPGAVTTAGRPDSSHVLPDPAYDDAKWLAGGTSPDPGSEEPE